MLLVWGCGAEPTQTWLFIHADPSLAPAANNLRITVRPAGDDPQMTRTDPVGRSGTKLANLFLVPLNGDASRTFEVFAELLEGETVRETLRVGGGYVDGETRVINAYFDASTACAANLDCGEGQTCQSGRCVGSCFPSVGENDDTGTRQLAGCGECTRCAGGTCDPLADGTSCGCDGDECRDGVCVPATRVRKITGAEGHACALTSTGLYCWGDSRTNQLGQGQGDHSDRPIRLESPETQSIVELALGAEFTCGRWIRSGPSFGHTCWGWGATGSFGMGPLSGSLGPTEAADPSTDEIISIRAGRFGTCILRATGLIQCSGSNSSEQAGRPIADGDRFFDWQDIEGPWDGLATGFTTTCGLRDGQAHCWGGSTFDSSFSFEPACVPDESGACASFFESIVVHERRGCGLDGDGRAYCWGGNEGGLFGVDGSEFLASATAVDTDLRFGFLTMGKGRAICGIALDGGLYCWGGNENGTLGTGDQVSRTRPVRVEVDAGDRWLTVLTAPSYTCAIREDEQLYCWGSNGSPDGIGGSAVAGRLGLGLGSDGDDPATRVNVLRPERVCFSSP